MSSELTLLLPLAGAGCCCCHCWPDALPLLPLACGGCWCSHCCHASFNLGRRHKRSVPSSARLHDTCGKRLCCTESCRNIHLSPRLHRWPCWKKWHGCLAPLIISRISTGISNASRSWCFHGVRRTAIAARGGYATPRSQATLAFIRATISTTVFFEGRGPSREAAATPPQVRPRRGRLLPKVL